ncbi:AsmA-like C-terminal region-containing protein [Reinekea marina]|uniref:YhdP family protein n=1 Tax=Reinekea marina TaxID=1310421 RepID=A0ABV7WVA0_9GAMM|nr:AsmA-like C-terminal region-containing protein [Reinekea marina]MDN3650188.1 AsmA-like C-terminal region-containing protein [Reinekea marina]
MNIGSIWRALKSAVLKVFVFWVLLFAVYLALGRQFFPYIERYETSIEQWLSGQFQERVEIGSIKGEWARFGPIVTLTNISIGESLDIKEMVLAPGVFESLSHGGLSFLKFELSEFHGHLKQSEQGWQLIGLKGSQQAERPAFSFDKLLKLLQRQQNIQFIASSLKISPLELPSFNLTLNKGELSGYEGHNSLTADAQIEYSQLTVPVELQAEFHQNNPNLNSIYVKHGAIDFAPWLNKSASMVSEAKASGEYWLNFNGTQWRSLTARSMIEVLTVEGKAKPLKLTDVKSTTVLEKTRNGFFAKSIVDTYSVNDLAINGTELTLDILPEEYRVTWSQLSASLVGAWLAMNDTSDFWGNLGLQGDIHKGMAHYQFGEAQRLKISSTFSNTRVNAYMGVPGLDNLSGTVTVDNLQGQIMLNPSESRFRYPVFNDDSLLASIEKSIVDWRIVEGVGVLLEGEHSANIQHLNDSKLPLNVQWFASLKNQAMKNEGYENSLGLVLGAPEINNEWVKYVASSKLIPDSASRYVLDSFLSGSATEAEFGYFSRGEKESRKSHFDLVASVNSATLSFLEGWSPLTVHQSQLSINQESLNLEINSAQYEALNISRGDLSLDFSKGDLQADFGVEGDAFEYLRLFKTGALQPVAPAVINDWQATGNVHSEVSLEVNLNKPNELNVTSLSDVLSAELKLVDLGLELSEINGLLQFNNKLGFEAKNIEALHAGVIQKLSLSRDLSDNRQLVSIEASGETPLAFWGEYFNDPYLKGFSESVAHQTDIKIYDDFVRITVNSDFIGPEFNLPIPLNKQSDDAWPVVFDININNENEKSVHVDIEDRLQGLLELSSDNEITRASFSVGQALKVHPEEGVFIDVQAHYIDGQAWWQTIQNMRSIYSVKATESAQGPSFESKLKEINVNVNLGSYLGRDWSQAAVQLLRNNDAWLIEFEADEGVGNVLVPHSDDSMFADIEWLSIETEEPELPWLEEQDPLTEYLPSDVPNMEIQIKNLVWNEQDMGDWRATLTSTGHSLSVNSIVGNMPGATLTGDMVWRHEDEEHFTDFSGNIITGDVLTVLNEWEYAPVLTSRDGLFNVSLNWLGSPAFFDFKRVQGKINLALTKGAILKVEEYEGIKLIGLLNFTRVLQRIALDFSDLLSSGITFDTIEGELLFDRGFARVGEGLVIDGASTNFQFSGDADLLANVIDIDMVLTVPLSSTFPLVALLAGVSPQAAAAIYVTERVFNNELKKISSARMHITGSFEEPIIKFYRVFDSQLGNEDQTVTDRLKSVVPSTANP